MKGLTEFEQAVLDKQLVGEHPTLAVLRQQAENGRLLKRKMTGVGFYCDFEIDPSAQVSDGDFQISDVKGELSGLAGGAGFVLFIRAGRISMLEGFSFDEPWPEQIRQFSLSYDKDPRQLKLP